VKPRDPPEPVYSAEPIPGDLRLAVVQHVLYWAAVGLLAGLVVRHWQSPVWIHEVAARQNMLLPSPALLASRDGWMPALAAAALVAVMYLRLRRMVNWREVGRRPLTPLWAKFYLAACVLPIAGYAAAVFAEQMFLARPALVGDVHAHLPGAGVYLFGRAEDHGRLWDFSDPEVGYRHRPDIDEPALTCGSTILWGWADAVAGRVPYRQVFRVTDSAGHIGYAGAAAGDADIAVIGDSFAAGDDVPRRTAWPVLLGRRTGAKVYNMGFSGSGPQQQFAVFRKHPPPGRPKTVIWCIYEGNDVHDSAEWERFRPFALEGKRWNEVAAFTDKRFKKRLGCSVLAALWRARQSDAPGASNPAPARGRPEFPGRPMSSTGLDDFDDPPPGSEGYVPEGANPADHLDKLLPNRRWEEVPVTGEEGWRNPFQLTIAGRRMEMSFAHGDELLYPRPVPAWRSDPGWKPIERTIAEFAAHCRANGARLMVVIAPLKARVYWEWIESQIAPERLRGDVYPRMRWFRADLAALIAETCAAEGVECLDLAPALRDAAARGRYVYLHHDPHWSPLGHDVVAEAIRARLAAGG
jgi:hypothetical protein